ncbi:MAG TPA: nucleoside deaminase [Streptosporangiaceae bacterium]|nr:nucleoside deaminase [Streptosporangiaceae bacterium]
MTTGYPTAFEPAMRQALTEAAAAAGLAPPTGAALAEDASPQSRAARADVPVGAVILDPAGVVLARGHNLRELADDPTAHAEIVAIRAAARTLGSWRLDGCTLVVTLEPCTMCAGAVSAARLARLVYGAVDPKAGAVGSLWDVLRDRRLPHRTEVVAGVLAEECGQLLREFFAQRRG